MALRWRIDCYKANLLGKATNSQKVWATYQIKKHFLLRSSSCDFCPPTENSRAPRKASQSDWWLEAKSTQQNPRGKHLPRQCEG